MDLVKAIKTKSLKEINELVDKMGIPKDPEWSDYVSLNCSLKYGRKDIAMFLLEKNCRVNKISDISTISCASCTPLHNAVKMGDEELVTKLLKMNASITALDSQGNSPLHLAFLLAHGKITDMLLDFIYQSATYANPNNNHGLTHFHIACTRDNVNIVSKYMKIASNLGDFIREDSPYYAGYTAVHFAIHFQSPLVLKLLLDNGIIYSSNQIESSLALMKKSLYGLLVMVDLLSNFVQPNKQSKISQFHIACLQNDPALISTFLSCGADVNDPINEEAVFCPLYSPLHYAVEANCRESVQLLLQHGADPDFQNADYMTPLHLSLYTENREIADLLYASSKKRTMDMSDCNGLNYFHVAVSMNDIEVVEKFLNRDKNKVNARIDRNQRNFAGYTPLHIAARYGKLEIARLLIQRGANVNANDMGKHGTPLHLAFSGGHPECIQLLLECGARIDSPQPDDKTMLHLLVEMYMEAGKIEDNYPLVEYYVRVLVFYYGLDIDAKDCHGYTALHYACTKISVGARCAKLLLECGADINAENNVADTPFEISFYDAYRNNAEDYMLLYDHVQTLRTLGFVVHAKNNECCAKLLEERNECQMGAVCFQTSQLTQKQEERERELRLMKNMKLSLRTSLYQFVRKNSTQLREFGLNNDKLQSIINSGIAQRLQHFGYLVELQCRRLHLQKMHTMPTLH